MAACGEPEMQLPDFLRPFNIHDPCPTAPDEAARALCAATRKNDLPLMRRLLEHVPVDSARRRGSQRPLHIALSQQHWDAAKLLLHAGADPNAFNGTGRTAVHVACAHGVPLWLLAMLMLRGGDALLRSRRHGRTPRQVALSHARLSSPFVALLALAEAEAVRLHGVAGAGALARVAANNDKAPQQCLAGGLPDSQETPVDATVSPALVALYKAAIAEKSDETNAHETDHAQGGATVNAGHDTGTGAIAGIYTRAHNSAATCAILNAAAAARAAGILPAKDGARTAGHIGNPTAAPLATATVSQTSLNNAAAAALSLTPAVDTPSLATTTAEADAALPQERICSICHLVLRDRPRAFFFLGRYATQTPNRYVSAYVASGCHERLLAEERFHRLADKAHLRKEVTETWAVLEGIDRVRAALAGDGRAVAASVALGLVDLCAGASLTSACYGMLHPATPVLAVDRLREYSVPHFEAPMAYMEADILRSDFVTRLVDRMSTLGCERGDADGHADATLARSAALGVRGSAAEESKPGSLTTQGFGAGQKDESPLRTTPNSAIETGEYSSTLVMSSLTAAAALSLTTDPRYTATSSTSATTAAVDGHAFLSVPHSPIPYVLVGMHLCGELSVRAVETFAQVPAFCGIVLSPCCFPSRRSQVQVVRESGVKGEAEQYAFWANYLADILRPHCKTVEVLADADILSTRNRVIVGYR